MLAFHFFMGGAGYNGQGILFSRKAVSKVLVFCFKGT